MRRPCHSEVISLCFVINDVGSSLGSYSFCRRVYDFSMLMKISFTEGMNCAWKLFDVVFTVVFRTDKIEFMQSQVNPQFWDSNCRFFLLSVALMPAMDLNM